MTKVFYIDPQSYNNLAVYDHSLLSGVRNCEVTYYHNSLYQSERIPGAVHKSVFVYSSKKGRLGKTLSYISSIWRIGADVIRERPDVVHIQWLRFWLFDLLFACCVRLAGCKLIFTAHNALPHNPHKGDRLRYRIYYRLASAIIVHTKVTKNELCSGFGVDADKINVIHHGILDYGTDMSQVLSRSSEIASQLDIRKGDLVFSCLGYQYVYKGIGLVVDVWERTPKLHDNPRCHLLIVGKNRNVDASLFERACRYKNVYVLDEQISDIDFNAYLKLTSVILLPYISASQSGLLFSAMCSDTPVMVSNIGGLAEPLSYAGIGWNIGDPTSDNLSDGMLRLLDNPEELARVGSDSAAFIKVREIYSWNTISEQTSQLYIRLSGKN